MGRGVVNRFFENFLKVFRFGNSCALCARLPRQLRAGACYARVLVACVGGAGFGLPAFWWVFRRFSVGVLLAFLGVVLGWVFGCVWVGVVGERERQRQPNKRERAHGVNGNGNGRKL